MRSNNLNTKSLGIALVIGSIILLSTSMLFTNKLMKAADAQCEIICGPNMESNCPHSQGIPIEGYVGITTSLALLGLGTYTLLSKTSVSNKEIKLNDMLDQLKEDEKRIIFILKEEDGIIFQNELVEKTGFSKAKVSRILDKLEAMGLIERKRHGMTNIIILKLV